MSSYPITREYLALLRYMYRHRFNFIGGPAVDPDWFETEKNAIGLLLAHDDHPSEDEYYSMLRDEYGIITSFPFLEQEVKNDLRETIQETTRRFPTR